MATWNSDNIVITKKGEEVLSKVIAGIGKLTISRVVTGADYVSPSKLYSQTQVSGIRQELDISSYSTTNEGTSLALRVSNEKLESPYPLYQIGIYVTHPDFSEEILYVIAQCDTDNPDIIPLPSETPVSLNYNFYLAHSGTSNVEITVSDAGLVSVGEFDSYKQEVSAELKNKAPANHTHTPNSIGAATTEQGKKADSAVQSIQIGGIEQGKNGGVVNLPAYPTSLPANGGNANTANVAYLARGVESPNGKVKLWEDKEGGNLRLVSPDGNHSVEMDLYNDTDFRMYFLNNGELSFPVSYNFATKKFNINGNADTVDGMDASDFLHITASAALTHSINDSFAGTYSVEQGYTPDFPTGFGTYGILDSRVYGTTIQYQTVWFDTGIIIHRERIIGVTEWSTWKKVNDGGNAYTLGGIAAGELERVRTAIVGGETVDASYTALQAKVGDRILRAQVEATAGFERIMLWISTDGGATWTEIPLGNAATVNGLTVQTAVPANAKFTDTTYGIASTSANGLVSTGTQHFGGYKTVPMLGLRTTGKVGTQPSSDINTRIYFTNADVNAPFGEIQNCIRNVSYTSGEVITAVRSFSNDRTGVSALFVIATNNNSGNYVTISDPTVSSSASCLRKLASGTAAATTSNCPSGAWYGKHD